jgi:hypothetical protein
MLNQVNSFAVIVYVFFWLLRIRGCIRRGRQPWLRGPDWFFDVHVQPGFYEGAGRRLLRRYWLRMMIPFAVDIPIATAIIAGGHLLWLNWLMIGLAGLIHINHVISVDIAERQARPFAVEEDEKPVASIALSLATRRLRDYTTPALEWSIALAFVAAFALGAYYYKGAPEHTKLRLVFGEPLFMLYLQFGMLYVKTLVLAWRSPVPQALAAEHMKLREETRKYYLRVCDFHRIAFAAGSLFWPVVLTFAPDRVQTIAGIWFVAWMTVCVIATVVVEIKRKRLADLSVRARPVKLPDLLHQSDLARWPVCYQPSAPMLMLKGARGYSLNLANALAHYGAAYLAGFAVLVAVLRMAH